MLAARVAAEPRRGLRVPGRAAYVISRTTWCLQGTGWGTGPGLACVGCIFFPHIAIGASRLPAEVGLLGLLRLVLRFLTRCALRSGAERDAVRSPEP